MRILAVSDGTGSFKLLDRPCYLKSYDIEAFGGRGSVVGTADEEEAIHFDTAAEAHAAWNTQSKVRPLREDGKPNKPLTAFTIEIIMTGRSGNDHHRI